MNRRSLLALVLCLCLLLCAGCQTEPPVETPPPTTAPVETVPPTTAPVIDPAATYADAFAALGTEAVKMTVNLAKTVTVAGQVFTTESDLYMDYWNIGTPEFTARVKESADMGQFLYELEEFFGSGSVYQHMGTGKFTDTITAEDFAARYPSVQLLDPSLYTLTQEDSTIRFTDATAVESWLADEDAELIDAQGTLQLNAAGAPDTFSYEASYRHGPGEFAVTCTVTYAPSTQEPAVPTTMADYTAVEDIDGLWLMEAAYGYLLQARQYTSSILATIQSQAAGFALNEQRSVDSYITEKGTDYRFESSLYAMDSTGDFQQEVTEKFIGGKYTIAVDGGAEEADPSVTASVIKTAASNILLENVMDSESFTGAEITNLGSLLYVEYTCDEELAQSIQQYIYGTYFGSATLLDDMASAYNTNKMEFYLALDSYTMLPTAMGYLYEGAHTIDGYEYLTLNQLDQSFDLASITSHETIYEEPSPDTEPENKPTPLFYKVTGDNGQQMWLFGTIHVGDDRTAFLPSQITDALKAADALAVECDTKGFEEQLEEDEALQAQVSELYYYSDGPIADHLDTEDLYEDARKVLRATGNYFYNSEYQKASVWSSAISNYYLAQGRQLTGEKGIESRLERIAEENGVPLWEVESSLFQIGMLNGYSDHLQEFDLYSAVYSHGADNWESTAELYELWCAGDEAALTEEMAREVWAFTEEDLAEWEAQEDLEPEDLEDIAYVRENLESINAELEKIYQEYIQAMEISRNANMLEVAKEYLESGKTVFYAVGLAHLLAEDGLVNTLRDAGYTVELVTYN